MPDRDKLEEHIAEIDKKLESPQSRAMRVYVVLREHNFTTWDVLCFCSEWLAVMTNLWSWLEIPARELAKQVYYAHYFRTDEVLANENKAISESELTTKVEK